MNSCCAHAAFLDFEAVRERWFYKPDHQATRIVLGTLQAHYLNAGDPTWLFIVAPRHRKDHDEHHERSSVAGDRSFE